MKIHKVTRAWVFFIGKGTGGRFGWKVISWFTDSKLVHVGIVFEVESGDADYKTKDLQVFETSDTVFVRRSWKERRSGSDIPVVFEVNPEAANLAQMYHRAQKLVGMPYDYSNLLGLAFGLIPQKLANVLRKLVGLQPKYITMSNPLNVNEFMQCAKATTVILQAGGLEALRDISVAGLYPEVVKNMLADIKDVFTQVSVSTVGR